MSHSKYNKRGHSYNFDSYGADAKRFIIACAGCGKRGFRPSVLEDGFATDLHHKVIRMNLENVLDPLVLNDAGLCEDCEHNIEEHAQPGHGPYGENAG